MTAQTILPANSAASGGFDVANSCRFDDGSSAYMHKTPGGAGTSADLFTFSMWIKRGIISSSDRIVLFDAREDAENFDRISFTSDDTLEWKGIRSDSQTHNLTTSQVFRDPSAWMHLHFIWDSADGTADNRMRIYVNGTQVTAFGTRANPTSGLDAIIGAAQKHSVGSTASSGTYYDGYMAEVVYLDGQELTPDGNTGEFDSDSGIWTPKDVSGLTFGTNGFYLDFQASGNLGNDANGGTDLTEVNLAATDQSTDTCTNNFATLNPLLYGSNYTWSEGNLQFAQTATNWDTTYSSIGVTKGKWYMEFKGKVGAYYDVGVTDVIDPTNNLSVNTGGVAWKSNSEFAQGGNVGGGLPSNVTSPASNTYTADDIIGIALDVDNEAVYFAKNGTYEVNSDPTSGATKTGATTLPNSNSTYFFAFAAYKGSAASGTGQVNFGGGSVDAISSGNADADGHGNFEHAPPSGYFALCTKNLAEYGG
jgi:hypothetical protein